MGKRLFSDLPFGTRLTFHGKTYIKIALNMAEDENRNGNIFQADTQVEPIVQRTNRETLKRPYNQPTVNSGSAPSLAAAQSREDKPLA